MDKRNSSGIHQKLIELERFPRKHQNSWYCLILNKCGKKVAILNALRGKSKLWTEPIVVWCSKLKQNAPGGGCPVLALSSKNVCALNISVSINVVRLVLKSGHYTCPPSCVSVSLWATGPARESEVYPKRPQMPGETNRDGLRFDKKSNAPITPTLSFFLMICRTASPWFAHIRKMHLLNSNLQF